VPASAGRLVGVQSVDRALGLLSRLAESGEAQGVSQLAASTGLPPGTVHRLLASLLASGYVRRENTRYAVGMAAVRLADAGRQALSRRARPLLQRLAEQSRETANLAVMEGDEVVYVDQVASPERLRMFAAVGRRVPPHSTAVGKAILATEDEQRVRDLVDSTGLPTRTPRTITTLEDLLLALAKTREQGYAVDDEEEELGVRCVAVAVRDPASGAPVAALSLSGPRERVSIEAASALAVMLTSAAVELAGGRCAAADDPPAPRG
jgi:IclR family acetate operon transcriptional repressor